VAQPPRLAHDCHPFGLPFKRQIHQRQPVAEPLRRDAPLVAIDAFIDLRALSQFTDMATFPSRAVFCEPRDLRQHVNEQERS
jgi:hypothetical protein